MVEVHRYKNTNVVHSALNPLEDMICWVEGLTSASYVEELLKSNHSLQDPMTVRERSETVAKLVNIACKYLEQAEKGPKEVSFLPLYYALLNLAKAYVAIGPYGHELKENRWHGASYDAQKTAQTFEDDFITLRTKGAIPLFYQTLVGEDMFPSAQEPTLNLYMRDVYPYILCISAEYTMATGNKHCLIPFRSIEIAKNEGKQRIVATTGPESLHGVELDSLQAFKGLHREAEGSATLVSQWYDENDTASLEACLRPAVLYEEVGLLGQTFYCVPSSRQKLLLPEELPLLCAFFHMSSVVRYDPDTLTKVMDSKHWPMLLALRKHGTYRFLVLFWSFVTQCCTNITGG